MVIVIIEIFLLIERRHLLDGMLEFMDTEDRPATRYILRTGIESLGKYLQGLFVSMAFIGVATAVGMAHQDPVRDTDGHHRVLHRRHPLHRRTVCPHPHPAHRRRRSRSRGVLLMIVWQIIIQQIEGSFITPTVEQAINVSPLVVMLGVTAGITLGGLVGGIIAIPIAALIGSGAGRSDPMRRRAEAREQARRAAYLAAGRASMEAAAPDGAGGASLSSGA